MKVWNLLEQENAQHVKKDAEAYAQKHNLLDSLGEFKKGDVIEFWSGMNDHIRMSTKIAGFEPTGEIYLFWDCYWFPIKNNDRTKIVKKEIAQ